MVINKEKLIAYLTGEISYNRNQEIDELCDFIGSSSETITLIINSNGGDTMLSNQLINVIKDSIKSRNIKINAAIMGIAFSSAAYISMACSDLKLTPGSSLLFHGTSLHFLEEMRDKAVNFKNYLISNLEHSNYLNSLVIPFLTRDEIKRAECEDIYINWNDSDLEERIKRHYGR